MSILSGTLHLELTTADMTGLLTKINDHGVHLWNISLIDSVTVTIEIDKTDLPVLRKIVSACGASVKIKRNSGLPWIIGRILSRPVLLAGLGIHLLFMLWLPARVLFVTVEGNTSIPDQLILEQADLCGIHFGASRRAVRSEKMKNRLLSAIPSLQWAGINTSGCTAVISVKERSENETGTVAGGVRNIVASKDGVISSCSAWRGELRCQVGQAVSRGDILISGYEDLGLCTKAVSAEGEIYAQTKHEITVFTPAEYQCRVGTVRQYKNYGLRIGKKRIFFNNSSGIPGASCDKIYSEYYVTLPGDYKLPIALFVTTVTVAELEPVSDAHIAQVTALNTARSYLHRQMISGKILLERTVWNCDSAGVLYGQFICNEMIGRVQYEGIYGDYGKSN